MRRGALVGRALLVLGLTAAMATATPTTNIWNPSTDVQAKGTLHLGIDNYFSTFANRTRPFAAPVDLGLTYGVGYGFEVGVDVFEPAKNPLQFNVKWGYPERGKYGPAFAIGLQAIGIHKSNTGDILYGLISKTIPNLGRFTVGPYWGQQSVIGKDNVGAILAWDRSFGKRWWASVDWAEGHNAYSALALGGSYKFSPKVSLLVGYVFLTDHQINNNDAVTTQLDIDF